MTKPEMIRTYLEKTIADLLETDSLVVDPDGDIPIRSGSAVSYARLGQGPSGPMVRVFAPLLHEVEKTPELVDQLNEMNSDSYFARFFWTNDQVICSVDLVAESLDVEEVRNALDAVGYYADQFDDTLKERFGGKRMIEEEPPKDGPGADPSYL